MIQTHDLTRKYGSLTAVHSLNLHVPAQTIFGFIGPNGAGKTTTLRMLGTLLRPTAGQILIDGLDANEHQTKVRRRIGFLSDLFGLYDDLKCWEYLDYFCGAYGVEDHEAKIEEALRLTGLEAKRNELIKGLSRGMKQRMGIARTLVYDPKVLLLDEPSGGLDPLARISLRDLLKTLRSRGCSIIVSSHILTELSDMCDTVGLMERGRLVISGSIDEILSKSRKQLRLVLEGLGPREKALEALQDVKQVVDVQAEDIKAVANTPIAIPVSASETSAPDDPAAAQALALPANLPGFKIEMGFTGKREDLPALHKKLVEAGVPVVAFFPKQENLEDLFLRHSTGATN